MVCIINRMIPSSIKSFLFQATSIIPLVFFRVVFGGIMLWEITRYFSHGWIKRYWIDPDIFFSFNGFHWLEPWSGNGMYYHFYALGILAIFIGIGFLYRISTVLFFLAFTYIFLLDKTNYLNHFYLISLLSFILIFLPANRKFSVDALLFPHIKSDWIPNWSIWWLKIQLGIAYFFGGIAKLNADWLQGEPMRAWLANRTEFPLIGKYFEQEWMVYIFSYGGLFLDLLIVPFLIIKRTRWAAFIIICCFHLMNAKLFKIGIFPWFMILATAIFLPLEKLYSNHNLTNKKPFQFSKLISYGIAIYLLIQITVPFRHLFLKGNVNWTEEGHRFAWHMKLRDKRSKVKFYIKDNESGEKVEINMKDHLSRRQLKKIGGKPDMLLYFSKYLRQTGESKGLEDFSVVVDAKCSLNGRKYQRLLNDKIDLSKQQYPLFSNAKWIKPLTTPLKE